MKLKSSFEGGINLGHSLQSHIEANVFIRGELTELSLSTKVELGGLVKGYVRQAGVGR